LDKSQQYKPVSSTPSSVLPPLLHQYQSALVHLIKKRRNKYSQKLINEGMKNQLFISILNCSKREKNKNKLDNDELTNNNIIINNVRLV